MNGPKGQGLSAPLLAILSSAATIGCCLPIGFAAALGVSAASVFFTTLRSWLLAFSVALIGLGFWQQHRAKQCAVRHRWIGTVVLWTAVIEVVGMTLFPQQIAAFIADKPLRFCAMTRKVAIRLAICIILLLAIAFYLRRPSAAPVGQEPLLTLSSANISDFQKWFDARADDLRLILLLSPT